MKRLGVVAWSLCMLLQGNAIAQNGKLPTELASSANEFSGMCLHNGRLYLLPQLKNAQATNARLYSVDTAQLLLAADGSVTMPPDAVKQHALQHFGDVAGRFTKYGGFEAIAMIGNTVYLTVETDGDTDAIICGEWQNNDVVLSKEKSKKLPKIRKNGQLLPNAGYECLTTNGSKLITAFEYNYKGDSTWLYLVDTNLKGTMQPMTLPPIPFRLTDMTAVAEDKFWAINVYWNFNGNMKHREAYYKDIDPTADVDLHHWKPNECFARIIEITMKGNVAQWATKKLIPANDCINWEGMVPWRNGVLLISDDNKIPFLQTKLRYYPFDGKP